MPDYLAELAKEATAKEKTTLDQIHRAGTLRAIERWKPRDDMERRAKRGRPEDSRDILAQVPDVPPLPGDEL